MAGWMVDQDDSACGEIVRRALALCISGNPDKPSHALGQVAFADGAIRQVFVVHAADAVITNGVYVVMINRRNPPGKGKPALPGGLLDPLGGRVESAEQAAVREAMEEVGLDISALPARLIGTRKMARLHDVRGATDDNLYASFGIRKGDVFMVSTQAVRFDLPEHAQAKLKAGDDAEPGSARLVRIDSLTQQNIGIPDHYGMIMEALAS